MLRKNDEAHVRDQFSSQFQAATRNRTSHAHEADCVKCIFPSMNVVTWFRVPHPIAGRFVLFRANADVFLILIMSISDVSLLLRPDTCILRSFQKLYEVTGKLVANKTAFTFTFLFLGEILMLQTSSFTRWSPCAFCKYRCH